MNFMKLTFLIGATVTCTLATDLQNNLSSNKLVDISENTTPSQFNQLLTQEKKYILFLNSQRPYMDIRSVKVFLNLVTETKTYSLPLFENVSGTGFSTYDKFNNEPKAPYDRRSKYMNTPYYGTFNDMQFFVFSKHDELNTDLAIHEWSCSNSKGGDCTKEGNFQTHFEIAMTPYLSASIKLLKDYAGVGSPVCIEKELFAKNPSTQGWAKFYSTCDVPAQWEQSLSLPPMVKDCYVNSESSSKSYKKIQDSVISLQGISTSIEGNLIKVTMPVENMFDSGSATLKAGGLAQLVKVIESFTAINYKEIRVEGHTDSVPTSGKFPSNWELSSARAANVVKYMTEKSFDPKTLAAIGYADSRPIASNLTSDGRAKNRRIEFTIVLN